MSKAEIFRLNQHPRRQADIRQQIRAVVPFLTADAADRSARATPYSIEDIASPGLREAAVAWYEHAPIGRFRIGIDGVEAELRRDPRLMREYSSIVIVDDGPAEHWYISHMSPGMRRIMGTNKGTGMQVCDFPSPAIVERVAREYERFQNIYMPAVSQVSGPTDFGPAIYHRLWLPIVSPKGDLMRFINITEPEVAISRD